MDDSTSPSTTNTSSTGWPTPAVPGEGIPWRRRDQTDIRSPASGTVELSADVKAHGDGPQPSADAAVGDRPRDPRPARRPEAGLGSGADEAAVEAGAQEALVSVVDIPRYVLL